MSSLVSRYRIFGRFLWSMKNIVNDNPLSNINSGVLFCISRDIKAVSGS